MLAKPLSHPSRLLCASSLVALLGLGVWLGPIACRSAPAGAAAAESASAPATGPAATLAIPPWTTEGPAREVEVLHEGDGLKIAAIALRRGTPLPVHAVPSRISIQVVRGDGELSVGGSTIPVDAGSIVIVDPEVPHAMTPAHEDLVVLLVHYLGAPASP